MKFSIVIPTYNSAQYIERAVNSVQQQILKDGFDFEVIIIDDCSTDNTYSVVTSLYGHEENIHLFKQSQNKGPGIARNYGIQNSKGDYILFLDSDDVLKENALITLYENIEREDIIFFDWEYDSESNAVINGYEGRDDLEILDSKNKIEILQAYLLNKIDSSVIYAAFCKQFLQEHNLNFREGIHEDVDFLFHTLLKSKEIGVINKKCYLKNNRQLSIVNTITKKHLDGYLLALNEMYSLIRHDSTFSDLYDSFVKGFVNVVSSRVMRISNLSEDEDQKNELLKYTFEQTQNLLFTLDIDPIATIKTKSFKTKYEMIFEALVSFSGNNEEFWSLLNDIKEKTWSCYDIQNSIFLAPNEIRTCCKRYVKDGELKGDLVLISQDDKKDTFTYQEILDRKKHLIREINRENFSECTDCPFLKFSKWGQPLNNGIKYLSLEYHSVCNMKCIYCSDKYYGGKLPDYNIEELVNDFKNHGALDDVQYIVWGGGEPTLDKSFPSLLKLLNNANNTTKQRIITNATVFIPEILDLLNDDKAYIVTSIDAGSASTFKTVRQYSNFTQVLKNLNRYAETAPYNVIIKYILMEENSSIEEMTQFADMLTEYHLNKCSVQISCNFKSELISDDLMQKIVVLYGLLLKRKVEFVFLDDLIWQRMSAHYSINNFVDYLDSLHLYETIAKPSEYQKVIVWGTGAQAELIISKSHFFKNVEIAFFIDPREEVQNTLFHGIEVKSPSALQSNELPVMIAAVQSAPLIYQQYINLGLDKTKIIKQMIF